MNNEAYTYLRENDSQNLSSLTRKFMAQCAAQFDHYRLKFVALLKRDKLAEKDKYWKPGSLTTSVHQ